MAGEQFDTERHAVTVTYKDKTVTYYARELGYFEFHELNQSVANQGDVGQQGIALMTAVAVASLETKDGKPAFNPEQMKRLPREVAEPLADAAMKAQGIDLKKAREQASAEEAPAEGNG